MCRSLVSMVGIGVCVAIIAGAATSTAAPNDLPLAVSPSSPGGDVEMATRDTPVEPEEVQSALRAALAGPRLAPEPVLEPAEPRRAAAIVNLNSGDVFTDLQTAVTAATAGDELRIQQDISTGVVIIDRDLVLSGSSPDITVSATTDTGSSGDARGWFRVDPGVELHVTQLEFDGNGRKIYQAFRHEGTGSFDQVVFTDIQYEPSGPAYHGTAIVAFGDRVDVRDCSFSQVGRIGVLYFGTGVTNAIYENNTYVGKGDGDHLDYAVEVGAGATAVVWNSEIRDCTGIASVSGDNAAGILATTFFGPGTGILVRQTAIVDNRLGVAIGADDSDATVAEAAFNRVVGNAEGVQYKSTLAGDMERNWWGCNAGPNQTGCDLAVTGASAGTLDTDPWLVLTLTSGAAETPIGCSTSLIGAVTEDSDGANSSGLGAIPEGTEIAFDGGSLGTVSPIVAGTAAGVATTLFTAGGSTGQSLSSATLDNQTAELWLTLVDVLFCDGFESGDTSAWQ